MNFIHTRFFKATLWNGNVGREEIEYIAFTGSWSGTNPFGELTDKIAAEYDHCEITSLEYIGQGTAIIDDERVNLIHSRQ